MGRRNSSFPWRWSNYLLNHATTMDKNLRILIVAEHASAKFGGEAILPLHYFRLLRQRKIEAWLVVHARTRKELSELLPDESDRIYYVPDTFAHRLLHVLGKPFPNRIRNFTFGLAMRLVSQLIARRLARELVQQHRINVVHQPIPVSPKDISILRVLGAPLIVGPMNGGMDFPRGFRRLDGLLSQCFTCVGRWISHSVHRLLPGKLHAEVLLVANERTRRALPHGIRGQVLELVENAVDTNLWKPVSMRKDSAGSIRFLFAGRLVDWKAVDLLLEAFSHIVNSHQATLEILGDGPERERLQRFSEQLGLNGKVVFHGWLSQDSVARVFQGADVFILPSLYECGGAVVLEAMAVGLPVIATRWGGPADYLDDTCGILIEPSSREALVQGLAAAMRGLAESPARRQCLGQAARQRVLDKYDWQQKLDSMLEIYRTLAQRGSA
jgi:glycosyltransferase involved in cell wall biosynthesis